MHDKAETFFSLAIKNFPPEEKIPVSLVSRYARKVIYGSIDWEKSIAMKYGESISSAVAQCWSNCTQVLAVPSVYWRQQYIYRYKSQHQRCSFCGVKSCIFSVIGLSFCLKCWSNEAVVAEMALNLLKLGMSEDKYNSYLDLDISLQPAFQIGETFYYLKLDLTTFVELFGGSIEACRYEDAYHRLWRKDLEGLLVRRGLDWERASNIAHHVFPPDGITLTELANQIIEMYQGSGMLRPQNSDDIIEEISSPSVEQDKAKSLERTAANNEDEYKMPDNFFEMLSQKHSVLESNLLEELTSDSDGEEMNVEGKREPISFERDFYFFNTNKYNEKNSDRILQFDENEMDELQGFEVEVQDVPNAVDELEREILLEKRRAFLHDKLMEYGLDFSQLRGHSTYNHVMEQYLAGKGYTDDDLVSILHAVKKHFDFAQSLDAQIQNLSLNPTNCGLFDPKKSALNYF